MVKVTFTSLFLCAFLLAALLAAPLAASAPEGARTQMAHKAKKRVPDADYAGALPGQNHTVPVKKQKDAVHARAWTFREGSSCDVWQRQGLPTDNLHSRAVNAPPKKEPDADKGMDTSAGIDRALNNASGAHANKSALSLSVEDKSSSWREPTGGYTPDEHLNMESRHVVRAYADTAVNEDLSISLGPELILRNEQRERSTTNNQPDSALGMGMRFKLDF